MMRRLGVISGSTTGATQRVAQYLANQLPPCWIMACADIDELEVEDFASFDQVILGISTWGRGEAQRSWKRFLDELCPEDRFDGLRIAVFGLGDQYDYADTFVDAVGLLYDEFTARGARGGYGFQGTGCYRFRESRAAADGTFCGLPIDQANQASLTPVRCQHWLRQLYREGFFAPRRPVPGFVPIAQAHRELVLRAAQLDAVEPDARVLGRDSDDRW